MSLQPSPEWFEYEGDCIQLHAVYSEKEISKIAFTNFQRQIGILVTCVYWQYKYSFNGAGGENKRYQVLLTWIQTLFLKWIRVVTNRQNLSSKRKQF